MNHSRSSSSPSTRQCRIICVPFLRGSYSSFIKNAALFRENLDENINRFPELFPEEIEQGYRMKDLYWSKRLGLWIRRIEVQGISYTIRPSFVTPYLTGWVDDVEKALFLRKFSVPFWALAYAFGKNTMYWYRLEQALGRQPIVGTTIRQAEDLPEHVVADEKHSRIRGDKSYIATTCANGCVLGVSVANNAGEAALTQSYGVFKAEAQQVQPDYQPKTVNTDGWPATQLAWRNLFTHILLIACFLHVYIKLRDRSKLKFKELFRTVADRLWECYKAPSKASFTQRLRRFAEWARKVDDIPDFMLKKIEKLRSQASSFSVAYDFPGAYRTSNALDRLMQRMDRHLFATQYFHGSPVAAEHTIRAWALVSNFAPSNPHTTRIHSGLSSPAERLNQFRYHDNWLQNLFISGSQKGIFRPPQNPG